MAAAAAAAGPSNLNNIFIIGLTLLGVLLAAGYWWMENQKLADKNEQVAQRQKEADKLETIIKDVEDYQKRKDNLQKRIDLINQLKQNQKGPVKVMDRISQDLPDLVWLDKMSVSGGTIQLSGRGLNPNAVANFVEAVKNDPLFDEPELSNLTQVSVAPLVYSFDMTFHFSYSQPGAAGGATGTDTTGTGATSTSTAKK
jgi:type IV pilus assembly protein PilN